MMEKYMRLEGSAKDAYGKTELPMMDPSIGTLVYKNVKDLYDVYGKMELGRDYDSYAASMLQLTLDFGNSGATKFNKDWYENLMRKTFPEGLKIGIDMPNIKFDVNNIDKFDTQYNSLVLDKLYTEIDKLSDEEIKIMSGKSTREA